MFLIYFLGKWFQKVFFPKRKFKIKLKKAKSISNKYTNQYQNNLYPFKHLINIGFKELLVKMFRKKQVLNYKI